NMGERRKANPAYTRLIGQAWKKERKGHQGEAKALRKEAQHLPAMATSDPDFRRLRYVRYADDFLLSFIGPRSEAEEIKRQLGEFLRDELKLELSQAKTLISHARSEAARFLGYEVVTLQENSKQTARKGMGGTRSINGKI